MNKLIPQLEKQIKSYLDKIKTQEDAYVAVESMIESLDDPFTRFLTPEELEEQNMSISSELSGDPSLTKMISYLI